MKTIKGGLWPRAARRVATAHNRKHHGGKCVAFVAVDRTETQRRNWVPEYEVRCPACPAEEQASMELGS